MIKHVLAAAAFVCLAANALASDEHMQPATEGVEAPSILTIITSDDPQTQLMALILTRASRMQGGESRILLCSAAGDLALQAPPERATTPLAPRNMSPHGLLSILVADGVTTQVCAIYLPNSENAAADLIEGVTVATPPEIAAVMTAPQTRLFTF
jgi:hypothetical protein